MDNINNKNNIIVVGAGVSGVFTVLTLLENGIDGDKITLIDKGNYIEKRLRKYSKSL